VHVEYELPETAKASWIVLNALLRRVRDVANRSKRSRGAVPYSCYLRRTLHYDTRHVHEWTYKALHEQVIVPVTRAKT